MKHTYEQLIHWGRSYCIPFLVFNLHWLNTSFLMPILINGTPIYHLLPNFLDIIPSPSKVPN